MSSTVYLYPRHQSAFDPVALKIQLLAQEGAAEDPTDSDGVVIAASNEEVAQFVDSLNEHPDQPVWAVFVSLSADEIQLSVEAPREILEHFRPILSDIIIKNVGRAEDDESRIIQPAKGSTLVETILD